MGLSELSTRELGKQEGDNGVMIRPSRIPAPPGFELNLSKPRSTSWIQQPVIDARNFKEFPQFPSS